MKLQIDKERLDLVETRVERERAPSTAATETVENGEVKRTYKWTGPKHVSAQMLEESGSTYPGCRCEELGLREGMPVDELITLEEGCTGSRQRAHMMGQTVSPGRLGGWVCERLTKLRRMCGK